MLVVDVVMFVIKCVNILFTKSEKRCVPMSSLARGIDEGRYKTTLRSKRVREGQSQPEDVCENACSTSFDRLYLDVY